METGSGYFATPAAANLNARPLRHVSVFRPQPIEFGELGAVHALCAPKEITVLMPSSCSRASQPPKAPCKGQSPHHAPSTLLAEPRVLDMGAHKMPMRGTAEPVKSYKDETPEAARDGVCPQTFRLTSTERCP